MAQSPSLAPAQRPAGLAEGARRGAAPFARKYPPPDHSTSGTRYIRRSAQPPAWTLFVDDARNAVDARSHFVEFLEGARCDHDFIGRAELIFGELLGNVVRHAPGSLEISVYSDDEAIVLHVVDSGPPFALNEHRLPEDVFSERGRGLFIVEQLAADVSVERLVNRGNHIAVTLPRRP